MSIRITRLKDGEYIVYNLPKIKNPNGGIILSKNSDYHITANFNHVFRSEYSDEKQLVDLLNCWKFCLIDLYEALEEGRINVDKDLS